MLTHTHAHTHTDHEGEAFRKWYGDAIMFAKGNLQGGVREILRLTKVTLLKILAVSGASQDDSVVRCVCVCVYVCVCVCVRVCVW